MSTSKLVALVAIALLPAFTVSATSWSEMRSFGGDDPSSDRSLTRAQPQYDALLLHAAGYTQLFFSLQG